MNGLLVAAGDLAPDRLAVHGVLDFVERVNCGQRS
jgi:hypothetical protein